MQAESWILLGRVGGSGNCLGLGALLDSAELMTPEAREGLGPLMQRTNGFSIGAVQHAAAVAANVNQTDVLEDAEVLGDRGLLEGERVNDITDGTLFESEKAKDIAAARFCDSVEGVRGGGGASHGINIYP